LDLFQIPIDSTCSREYDHASLHNAHTNSSKAVATCDSVLAGHKAFNRGEQPAVKAAKPQFSNRNKMDIATGIEGAVTLRVQAWWRRPVTQFRRAHDDTKATQPVVGTHPKIAIFVVVACFTALSLDWR
jgi:hypothetical protein